MSLGTPAYMSPEQALGARDIDGRSDQYAVGCVLYEMLAGAPPYTGESARALIGQHLTAPVPNVRAVRPEVPQAVSAVLAKAMAKMPEARFATAAELAAALERAAPATHCRRTRAVSLTARAPRRTVALLAAATIGVAALLRSRSAAPLDEHLVAVAPFEVVGPGARSAGGSGWSIKYRVASTGPGRSERFRRPPSLRRWRGRADLAGAIAFGRRTGAGLVVYGQLDRTGR